MFSDDFHNLNNLYSESVGLGPHAEGGGLQQPGIPTVIARKKCPCEEEECPDCPDDDCGRCSEILSKSTKPSSDSFEVKSKLFQISKIAATLHNNITECEDIDAWVISKAGQAYELLRSIQDYTEYRLATKLEKNP